MRTGRHLPAPDQRGVPGYASRIAGDGAGFVPGARAAPLQATYENWTSGGKIRLEAAPLLVYRKLSIPKLDDANPKLDEFRHLAFQRRREPNLKVNERRQYIGDVVSSNLSDTNSKLNDIRQFDSRHRFAQKPATDLLQKNSVKRTNHPLKSPRHMPGYVLEILLTRVI